jgi:myb proto-oncogene protein
MVNRSGKQIREHYLNQLHPDLNNDPWNFEEDEKIIQLYNEFGGKWSVI